MFWSRFRNAQSMVCKSRLWIVRCPAPKSATGVTTASKNRQRSVTRTVWSHKPCLFAENARLGACKWNSASKNVLWKRPTPRIQTNHLWQYLPHSAGMTCPWERKNCELDYASFVRVTVLCAFESKPVAASNTVASWTLGAKRRISPANLQSKI